MTVGEEFEIRTSLLSANEIWYLQIHNRCNSSHYEYHCEAHTSQEQVLDNVIEDKMIYQG